MRSIGLRCEPRSFTWAISEGTLEAPILLACENEQIPNTYSFADGTAFLRSRLIQLLQQYDVKIAGIRTPEPMVRNSASFCDRVRIEGALIAACAEAHLSVQQGPLATLSSLLGVKSAKLLVESDEYQGIELTKFKKEKREAILMSVSILESEDADHI